MDTAEYRFEKQLSTSLGTAGKQSCTATFLSLPLVLQLQNKTQCQPLPLLVPCLFGEQLPGGFMGTCIIRGRELY